MATLHALRRSVISELELRRNACELKRATATLATFNAQLEEHVEVRTRQYALALADLRSEASARENAEASLRKSEERFRTLWETTTDAVLILDIDSIIRYANPAVRNVFGYEPNELAGQPLAMLQPERLRQAHSHGLARYVATGEQSANAGRWSSTIS